MTKKTVWKNQGNWDVKNGFIYFVDAVSESSWPSGIKIGFSVEPKERFKVIRREAVVRVRFLGSIPGTKKHEKALHWALHHRRMHGEWFSTNRTINDFVRKILHDKKFPDGLIEDPDYLAFKLGYGRDALSKRWNMRHEKWSV